MRPLPENHGLTLPRGAHPTRPWWAAESASIEAYRLDGASARLSSFEWPPAPDPWDWQISRKLVECDEQHPAPAPTLCDGQVWLLAREGVEPFLASLRRKAWPLTSDIPESGDNWDLSGAILSSAEAQTLLLRAEPVERYQTYGYPWHAWLVSDPRHPGKNVFWSAPARTTP